MIRRKLRVLAFLTVVLLFLSGCEKEAEPSTEQTQFWTTWPTVNVGTMEYEKLTVQPWNSGRCEAISKFCAAETETGYYLMRSSVLYYADKADLSTWVPVCNRPNCSHSGSDVMSCNAHYEIGKFVIKQGRIYFLDSPYTHPELSSIKTPGFGVFSRALDGTDLRLEYVNEDILFSENGGGGEGADIFTAEHWVSSTAQMNTDGTYTLKCYRVTEEGAECLVNEIVANYNLGDQDSTIRTQSRMRGEPSFNHLFLGDIPYSECRYRDGQPYFTDLRAYYDTGLYLAGNTLRLFRPGDGYYDVDLDTHEEIRVGDMRLENSDRIMFLPNCIIETTLFSSVYRQQPEGSTHGMELFDGESWRTVQLPKELQQPDGKKYLGPTMVTSDSIFFCCYENQSIYLYRIPIQDGQLHLEYCGQIK